MHVNRTTLNRQVIDNTFIFILCILDDSYNHWPEIINGKTRMM